MIYNFKTTYTSLNKHLFQTLDKLDTKQAKIILKNTKLFQELEISQTKDSLEKELLWTTSKDKPFAQAYAGHQFGHFTVLGDGRAMILWEHITPDNRRFDIQLKGSWRTKYSRGGDGKATVSSMIREYIYSFAMRNLNIPTSQSLAVIENGNNVVRDKIERWAILIRVMSSHIRFGSFEFVSNYFPSEELKKYTDYVIERHYPNIVDWDDKYLRFFEAVMDKTISMVVDWYRVGFVHGVMNTDNMSIVWESFDYGPCAFMNRYNPKATFSGIDTYGRYSFGNQKEILSRNLAVFADSLLPLVFSSKFEFKSILDKFTDKFEISFVEMMKKKLGITDKYFHTDLINDFLVFLQENQLDYTNTFLELMYPWSFDNPIYQSTDFTVLKDKIKKVWLSLETMEKNNPQRILRNNLLEEAIQEYAIHRTLDKVNKLLEAISKPYNKNDTLKSYQNVPEFTFDNNYKTHCNT